MTLSVAGVMPTSEAVVRMRDEAKRALASEPGLPEAHAALALAAVFEYDWLAADASFGRALAVDPVSHDVRLLHAQWYLVPLGRFADALQQTEMALTEDPLNLFLRNSVGMIEICRGNEDRGVAAFRQLLDLNDRMFVPNLWLCGVALKHGRFGEALTLAERAYAIESRSPMVIGTLAGALERSGDRERAERLRGELEAGEANGAQAGLVSYHLVRGDVDSAATCFERAIAQRDPCTSWILPRVFGDLLISSRHWPALAKAMNLPTS
jgi:tetratricopeptide (TPR) repeat protein